MHVPTSPAAPTIAESNAAMRLRLPFADTTDFDDARRGWIGSLPRPGHPGYGRARGVGRGRVRIPRRGLPRTRSIRASGARAGSRRSTASSRSPRASTRSPRPVQHDDRRGRSRRPGDRPAHLDGVRRRRARALPPPPRGAARDRPAVHAQPRRPLRRRARRGLPRRRRGRPCAGACPGGLPRARGERERLRGRRDDPAGHPHVRRAAAQRAGRAGRRRPRADDLDGHGDAHPADARHRPHGPGGDRRRDPHGLPARPGHRGAGRDALPVPRAAGAVHRRERHPQPAQCADAARRPGPRPAPLGGVPRRGDRAVRPRQRHHALPAPLAALGHRPHRRGARTRA